jgi:hypothetical protein
MTTRKVHITIHGVIEVPEDINLRDLQAKQTSAGKGVVIEAEDGSRYDVDARITYIEEWAGFPELGDRNEDL